MIRMGEGLVEESLMKETNFLAGLFQQIVADCKVLRFCLTFLSEDQQIVAGWKVLKEIKEN